MTYTCNKLYKEEPGTRVAGERKKARIFSNRWGSYGTTRVYIYVEICTRH
jgi:hypothetical protein